MLENIQYTALIFVIASLLVIQIMPIYDKLPRWFTGTVLFLLASSCAALLVSTIIRIWS